MTQLICGADGARMECEENDVLYVDEEHGNFAKCDMYKCPKCGVLMATGFGDWLFPDVAKVTIVHYRKGWGSILYKGTGWTRINEGAV